MPCGQLTKNDEPDKQNEPMGHGKQLDWLVKGVYVPARHTEGADSPIAPQKLPAGQTVHVVAKAGENVPTEHAAGAVTKLAQK